MILVTGAAGMIGANCIQAFNVAGRSDVIACDTFHDRDERWQNLAQADLYDIVLEKDLEGYISGRMGERISAVIHMGAISATTERDIERLVRLNYQATKLLWDFCTERRVPFLYASSAATYGDGSAGFDDDPTCLDQLKPLNAYGWSKHMADRRHVQCAAQGHAPAQWVGLKFFNVFGPYESHKADMRSVVTKIYPQVLGGETIGLFRSDRPDIVDGGQSRDFVYVRDCVKVIQWFLDHPEVSGIFNCGTGQSRSFLDLAKAVFSATKQAEAIEFIDMPASLRGKYQYFTEAKLTRLREVGCNVTFQTLEDAVQDYVDEWLATGRCP